MYYFFYYYSSVAICGFCKHFVSACSSNYRFPSDSRIHNWQKDCTFFGKMQNPNWRELKWFLTHKWLFLKSYLPSLLGVKVRWNILTQMTLEYKEHWLYRSAVFTIHWFSPKKIIIFSFKNNSGAETAKPSMPSIISRDRFPFHAPPHILHPVCMSQRWWGFQTWCVCEAFICLKPPSVCDSSRCQSFWFSPFAIITPLLHPSSASAEKSCIQGIVLDCLFPTPTFHFIPFIFFLSCGTFCIRPAER